MGRIREEERDNRRIQWKKRYATLKKKYLQFKIIQIV